MSPWAAPSPAKVGPAVHHGHEQGPSGGRQERRLPRGPLLPHQRHEPSYPAAARSGRKTLCPRSPIISRNIPARWAAHGGVSGGPAIMLDYQWPGNVARAAERDRAGGPHLRRRRHQAEHLPEGIRAPRGSSSTGSSTGSDRSRTTRRPSFSSTRGNSMKAACRDARDHQEVALGKEEVGNSERIATVFQRPDPDACGHTPRIRFED